MSKRNDQVFQLSLTEIAFIIAFLLMFLLGTLLVKANNEKDRLAKELASRPVVDFTPAELKEAQQMLVDTVSRLQISKPEEIISALVEESRAREEAARLKQLLQEQEARLTALEELQKAIDKEGKGQGDAALRQKIQEALALTSQLKEQLAKTTDNPETLEDMQVLAEKAAAAIDSNSRLEKMLQENPALAELPGKNAEEKLQQLLEEHEQLAAIKADEGSSLQLKQENSNLKGQVEYFKRQVGNGKGIPPCWVDASGRAQLLLSVDLRENDLLVERAWPAEREAEALALPNMQKILAAPETSYGGFLATTKSIYDQSVAQNCRHYVKLKSSISDAVLSDRQRLQIEGYFYKQEVRR